MNKEHSGSVQAALRLDSGRLRQAGQISRLQVLCLLTFAGLLIFARSPKLLLDGQVFGEEGTTYLRFAWNAIPLEAFFAPHQGYYSLLDNVVTLIAARVLPLAAAAQLFSLSALSIRLLTAYLIITTEYLDNFFARLLALLAFLLATGSLEGWMSLEYCHFCLPIGVVMILISTGKRWPTSSSRMFRAGVLLLAGFTGVTSYALVPLFWLKAIWFRTRSAWTDASLLTTISLVQFSVIFVGMRAGNRHGMATQFRYFGPILLQRTLLLPFLTSRSIVVSNHLFLLHPGLFVPLAWLLLFAGFLLLLVLTGRTARIAWALIAAAALSGSFNWLGCSSCDAGLFAANPVSAGRYFFTADALIAIALSFMFTLSTDKRNRWLTGSMLALALVSGGIQYPRGIGWLDRAPAWKPQVEAWTRDPATTIFIAPSYWTKQVTLPPDHPDLHLPASIYDTTRPAP